MTLLKDKNFLKFVVKFILVFCICYYGTLLVIGLAAPGNYYSPFVKKYLDYVSLIKATLIYGTKISLSLFGIQTVIEPGFLIRIINGRGVIIAMDCVGYGVYSFWIAFVAANTIKVIQKLKWIFIGLLLLWLINVIRISLFLVAINRNWAMPFGIDHHTWFNIAAYLAIFTMMYFFERGTKEKVAVETIDQKKTMDHRP